jgi:hypothetical protein
MIPNTCTITNLSTGATGGINTTAEMETKCTQTKLDDELEPPLILQTTSSNTTSETVIKPTAVSSVTTGESNPGTVTTTGPSRSGSISAGPAPKTGSVNEVRVPSTTGTAIATEKAVTNEAVTAMADQATPAVVADPNPEKSGSSENPNPGAATAATATESKGEIGTWTSSTEVCPW